MTWSYRILVEDRDGVSVYSLHEVYYNEDEPTSWTVDPVEFVSDESRADVISMLTMALADARERPVLRVDGDRLVSELEQGLRDVEEGRVREGKLRTE